MVNATIVVRGSLAVAALAGLLVGCSGSTGPAASAAPCPAPTGEFPPTDCAFLVGRALSEGGTPLAGMGIRVDSLVPPVGYAYSSSATTTDAAGSFQLLIFRINRLRAPDSPDTATVGIKVYAEPVPPPGRVPLSQAWLKLHFAPLGQRVDTTRADLSYPPLTAR